MTVITNTNNSPTDLDLELLRAFVAVVEGGGFTRAAERLHRTQSTVSQQIKRLEVRLGAALLKRNTRGIDITAQGELLLGYARRLLALNEEALAALAETRLQGHVRLGAAQEIADGGLAELLAHFSRLHPGVHLEVRVDANLRLQEMVERGELDLAVLFMEPGQPIAAGARYELIESIRRVWVSGKGFELNEKEPLPLILSTAPCIFRNSVLAALDGANMPWRISLSTPSLAGIRAAVRAGLGVGVRTERWLEPDLRTLEHELPTLPDVELVLLTAANTGEVVVEHLRSALYAALSTP